MSLNPRAPQPPDFYICNDFYGQEIVKTDCTEALRLFSEQGASVYGTDHHQAVGFGTCSITITTFVPDLGAVPPISVILARDLAAWIIDECVSPAGIGGWGTVGFQNTIGWITEPGINIVNAAINIPSRASFMSVIVHKIGINNELLTPNLDPGIYDPGIATALADAFWDARNNHQQQRDDDWYHYTNGALLMEEQASRMQRGGDLPWYELNLTAQLPDAMIYVCDTNLGSPTPVDCSHLEYSELGAAGDTIRIGPGATKLLASKTCNVAISASTIIVIRWAQIRAALDTLINTCVIHPLHPARGGKAYYKVPKPLALHARDTVTGLNALPPHLNVTLSG